MTNKNIFASNLRKYMDLKGKTRKDVCQALNISYYTFSDWVNGKKYPRMDKVELLSNYFGILKSDLIEEKNESLSEKNKKSSPESLLLTDEEIQMVLQRRSWSDEERMLFQQLWDTFDKMSAKDRSMILGMIEAAAAARNRP